MAQMTYQEMAAAILREQTNVAQEAKREVDDFIGRLDALSNRLPEDTVLGGAPQYSRAKDVIVRLRANVAMFQNEVTSIAELYAPPPAPAPEPTEQAADLAPRFDENGTAVTPRPARS